MPRHVNIPIFIPHLGCPNQCVFCNQRTISGVNEFKPEQIDGIISDFLDALQDEADVEIAFFGGSFTGISEELMISLLEIANKYIKSGRVQSLRCSTRPDYINERVLDILEEYNLKTIELGLQSVSDKVLLSCKRGHSFSDEEKACRLIVERGFNLVGQMMIGLPDSTKETEEATARFIASSGAIAARIYPTVVFKDTELCNYTSQGDYIPLSVDDAVERTFAVYKILKASGVEIIRIGLCSAENLSSEDTYYAGPNHPAIGELVENREYLDKILFLLENQGIENGKGLILYIYVGHGCVSKAAGHNKKNKAYIKEKFDFSDVKIIEKDSLCDFEISVRTERKA